MSQILQQLQTLGKQKRLFPAEEIITSNLVDFETLLPEKMSNEEITDFESALIPLLSINNGTISCSCSERIATCLIFIYKKDKSPKLWNLITATTKNPSAPLMYCTSCVVHELGRTSKSMLAGLMKTVTKQSYSLIHPSLVLSRSCYHISAVDVKSYNDKVFGLAKYGLISGDEKSQLAAARLLRTMVKTNSVNEVKLQTLIEEVLNSAERSAFVIDEICYLVARLAAKPLLKQGVSVEAKEFTIGTKVEASKTDFSKSFFILKKFKKNFSLILRHYLEILPPQFIYDNVKQLFDFVRKIQITELFQVLLLFGNDVKMQLFAAIASEKPVSSSQLLCLKILLCNKEMAQETAAICLQLSSSEQEEDRKTVCGTMYTITTKYPDIAQSYIETAMLYLAYPPEDNPGLAADLIGFSTMAAGILGGTEDKEKMCNSVKSFIETFLQRALGGINIFSADYFAAFKLMVALPDSYIPTELAGNAVNLMLDYIFEDNVELIQKGLRRLIRTIMCCLASHPFIPHTEKFISLVKTVATTQTSATCLSAIYAMTKIQPENVVSTANKLYQKVIALKPQSSYIKSLLPNSFPLDYELITSHPATISGGDPLVYGVSRNVFLIKATEFFPEFLGAFTSDESTRIAASTATSTTNILTSHLLLLRLVKSDKAHFLPENLHHLILDTLTDENTDIERMRISAEVVAIWAGMYNHTAEVIDKITKWNGQGKCLVYASLFQNAELTDNQIINSMHELDAMAKLPATSAVALYALSTLFDFCSARLSVMPMVGTQMSILTSIIHSDMSLNPYILYFITCCFSKLLPVLSPQKDSRDAVEMRQIVQMISQTSLSFTKPIMFRTARSVIVFASFLTNDFKIIFPTKLGVSTSQMLSACGAFADYMRIKEVPCDLFDTIPPVLILLQRSNDPRPEEFIVSVAASGSHVSEWVRIVKNVLSANSLPGFVNATVEPHTHVKRCCLKVISKLIDNIEPGVMLDDIVTSATRAVETHNAQLCEFGFPVLVQVIDKFSSQQCIDLYEPQFASSVKNGFLCNMSYSSQFMLRILSVADKKVENKQDITTIINPFSDGLATCELNPSSVCVAASACNVAKESKNVEEQLACLERFADSFADVVLDAKAILAEKKDWNRITLFRQQYEKALSSIYSALAWLLPKQTKISSHDFVAFLIRESQCDEIWRVTASFSGLAAIFEYGKGTIKEDLIIQALNAVSKDPMLTSFVISCAKRVTASQKSAWNMLIDFVSTTAFTKEAAALLIRAGDEEEIANATEKISEVALREGIVEIFTLLYEKTPKSIEPSLDILFRTKNVSIATKASIIERAMKRYQGKLTRIDVSEFLWTIFRKGGLQIIASTLVHNKDVGSVLFAFHELKHIEELCLNDSTNAGAYLQFVTHGVSYTEDEKILKAAARIAVTIIAKWGDDSIVGAAVILFNTVKAKNKSAAKSGYFEASGRDQQVSISNVTSAIKKKETKNKVRKLKNFSGKVITRHSEEDEWQML